MYEAVALTQSRTIEPAYASAAPATARNGPVAGQVLPGDTLQTTCYYDNPNPTSVGFGPKTTDEMCFDFIAVFPYGTANKKCGAVF